MKKAVKLLEKGDRKSIEAYKKELYDNDEDFRLFVRTERIKDRLSYYYGLRY